MTGQFVSTKRGPVKLFAWSEPQATTPADALKLHARRCPLAARPRLGPGRGQGVPAVRPRPRRLRPVERVESLSPRARRSLPRQPLRPGSYALRRHPRGDVRRARLRVPPHRAALGRRARRSASGRTRAAPAVLDALLPLCASLLALAFAAMLLRSFLRRRSGEKVLWGCGFLLFAVAAACEAVAQRSGWSPGLFRTYYLAGGVLDGRLPRRRLGLAVAAERERATGSPAGSRSRRRRQWSPWRSPASTPERLPRPRTGGLPPTRHSRATHSSGRSRSTPWAACS